MKKKRSFHPFIFVCMFLLAHVLAGFDLFHSENSNVENGNQKLKGGKPNEALELYDKAAKELPDEPGVQYNRGIALYKLGKFEEAKQALSKAAGTNERSLATKSSYNLGNTLYQLKKYEEAVEAYKRALGYHPQHRPSKWNLELALRKIQEEKKKKEQEKKKDEQKKQEQEKKKDEKKQQQEKKKDEQKKQEQEQKKDEKKPEEKRMDQTLDALDRNDKDLQKRRARMRYSGDRRRPIKDW